LKRKEKEKESVRVAREILNVRKLRVHASEITRLENVMELACDAAGYETEVDKARELARLSLWI
jgi:hypothetical protein